MVTIGAGETLVLLLTVELVGAPPDSAEGQGGGSCTSAPLPVALAVAVPPLNGWWRYLTTSLFHLNY